MDGVLAHGMPETAPHADSGDALPPQAGTGSAAGTRTPEQPAGLRDWAALGLLTLPTAVASFDLGALVLALPRLDAELGTSSTQLLWTVDVYGFCLAGCLLPMGTLADRIGRRRLLLLGASAFGVLSVAAAFAPSPAVLIGLRGLLGVAGATLMPCTLGLISAMFGDAHQRGQAIAVWVAALMGGAALAPVVSGLLLAHFWWGSVFLIAVPAMLVLVLAGPRMLPDPRGAETGAPDLPSVLLSLGAVLPIVYAFKELAAHGVQATAPAVVAAVIGTLSGLVFLRRQRRLTTPLLDLRWFRQPAFRLATAVALVSAAGTSGLFLLYSQHVLTTPDMPVTHVGLWLTPAALATAIGSLLTGRLRRRHRRERVIGAGLAVAATGCVLLAAVGPAGGLVIAAVAVAVIHLGLGPVFTVVTDLIVAAAPCERAGSAAAISETTAELGAALGVSLCGSLAIAAHSAALPLGTTTGPSAGVGVLTAGLGTAGLGVASTVAAVLFAGLAAMAVRRLGERPRAVGSP